MEEEEKESSTKMASSFKIIEDLFLNWDGPDIVSESVEDWIRDFAGHSGKSTVGNFFQYCLSALSENFEEDFELTLWMMNLVAHYVADNESWLDTADELKNWGNLFLSEEDWEVPPPLWAITREKNSEEYRSWVEEEKLKELKEKKAEESLVTTSPVDLDQNDSGGSYVEPLAEGEVESSVSYCNLKKTSLHPQLTMSSITTMTSHQPTSPPTCQFCSQRAEQL